MKTRPPYDYAVHLVELMADDPAISAALWRLVGSSGTQAPHVIVVGPPDDPVYLHLPVADPVAVQSEISWMVRLIDVAGAVAARGYRRSARARVDLQIADPDAPWNAGRWVLEASEGAASLKPGGDGTVETSIGDFRRCGPATRRRDDWPPPVCCGRRIRSRWMTSTTCSPARRRRCSTSIDRRTTRLSERAWRTHHTGAMAGEFDDIRGRLEGIAEELADLAIVRLRESIDAGGHELPVDEKRLTRARRAVEKAVHILAEPDHEIEA